MSAMGAKADTRNAQKKGRWENAPFPFARKLGLHFEAQCNAPTAWRADVVESKQGANGRVGDFV